jgi:hypothetical protein
VLTGELDVGCLGGGVLVLWEASEPTGEACTAATMNAHVTSVASLVNSSVTLMAGLICAAQVQGDDLPAGGAPIDLHAVLTENLEGAAFTTASLERLAPGAGGRETYRIVIDGTIGDSALSVTAVHAPGDDAGDGQSGVITGHLDRPDPFSGPYRKAFSVRYAVAGGEVSYELRSGNTAVTVERDALFGPDGAFDYEAQLRRAQDGSTGAAGGLFERAVIDGTTGLGTLVHAWQAGNHDGYTRVFQASTAPGAGGAPDSGVGYFGFGPPLDSPALGSVMGMWCNWSGPGSQVLHPWSAESAAAMTPKVQGQTIARDPETGLFAPVVNRITYAPTNSCDLGADAVSAGFRYAAGEPTAADLAALPLAPFVNDLVAHGELGAIPEIAPLPPFPER